VSAGRILLIVFGSILGLIGLGLLAGGGTLLWAHQTQLDDDGYLTSRVLPFRADGSAVATENLDLTDIPGGPGRWADLRVRARGAGGAPLFVGIGPRSEVERYLDGVRYAEVTDVDLGDRRVSYRDLPGTRRPSPPGSEDFWVAQAQGADTQTLTWGVDDGDWQIVAMNADGSAPVALTASLGVKFSYVVTAVVVLMVLGFLFLGGGVWMVVAGARGSRPPPAAGEQQLALAGTAGAGTVRAAAPAPAHPVDVVAVLDPELRRWLWLFKWLLAIPHYIVLAFLWIAYFVVTFIAFWAILFTGRYPRGMFEFTTGVLRWSWRVGYYAYSALGTDRYPPFTLERTDYPADLDVPYPERLSRGLVLVKWWLLAIPQYIVVAVFAGNWFYGAAWGDRWWGWAWTPFGGGLIGILTLFAAIALLVTGRYPRSLWDLIVGMNRWVFRVVAYASLMRDEYPPFKLER
jgi:hypothetical protein